MRHKIRYKYKEQTVEREITYIPLRYIIALAVALFSVAAVIGAVVALCMYLPYFYIVAFLIQVGCIIKIIASDDNPEYKVPWLVFVMVIPIAGFMLYLMFYSRTLKKKYIKRLRDLKDHVYTKDDSEVFEALSAESQIAENQARLLCNIGETHLFTNTKQTYFPLGEDMQKSLLADLERAENFIYMEYYIIDEGVFWTSVLEILKRKAASGVAVKLVYDDIGCMTTLSGNYFRVLKSYGIDATVFSMLRGSTYKEFNNRSHRKITVIDGKIGYTGGINIADEYINLKNHLGHFKDTAVRLEGEAVWELTRLFLIDFGINVKNMPRITADLFPKQSNVCGGYVVPFGDGPRPIYDRRVSKSVVQNMINTATKYVYITTPYLVVDNDLCLSIENAALRGVDVKIIVPSKSDSRIIAGMGRSYYKRLMDAGVHIYEYSLGFIHAKSYLADGEYAVIGTMNLDYRSMVHNFENGVWMYRCDAIASLKQDILQTLEKSIEVTPNMLKISMPRRFIRAVVRIFAPML